MEGAENKETTAVSLKNLEEFKTEMDAVVEKKLEGVGTSGFTFATTEQIKALFAEE